MSAHFRLLEADEEAVCELVSGLSVPEPIARVLVVRGNTSVALAQRFLRKSMNDLQSPFELEGIGKAAERIIQAILSKEGIVVHGDFDADGITASALLTLFLHALGARVHPFVPNRLIENHGISLRAIEFAQRHSATLVVTCDCGSSNIQEVLELKKVGVDTIVTDHHHILDSQRPDAILVNPKASDNEDYGELAGVGVAFMLAIAVRSNLRERGFFKERSEPNLKDYLDIVALGTVADMAPLIGQNRILVAKGLEQLEISKRPGIEAMQELIGFEEGKAIQSEDVGFRLAPRLNAACRLGHSEEALELLICQDKGRALDLARKMEQWNQERKELMAEMLHSAQSEASHQVGEGKASIVIASSKYHSGIIGLVAQRLAENYKVPVFVFAIEGDVARGSARSRCGIDLMAAMEGCKELMIGFGGHKEAGGCTIQASNLSEFKKIFDEMVLSQNVFQSHEVLIDAKANFGHLDSSFLFSFNRLRPFGIGNPEPVFRAEAMVVGEPKEMGRDHIRVTLREVGGPSLTAVGFGMWRSLGSLLHGKVEVAYSPEENEWNGRRDIRIRLRSAKPI